MEQGTKSSWGYRELILFSLPSLAASLLEPLASFVDSLYVARLSTRSLAALAVASAIFNTITWVFNFLIHTSTQAVSSHSASGEEELLWSRIKMASVLSLVLGLLSCTLLWFGRDWWFSLAGASESYHTELESYFFIRTLSQPFVLLGLTWLSILRGFSLMRETFVILLVTTLTNIFLSGLFLYQLDMGISGVAWGTLIAQSLAFSLCVIQVLKKHPGALSLWRRARFSVELWRAYGKDTAGMLMRSGSLSLTFFLATRSAGLLGVCELAAHQILLQLWLFSSFLIDGLAVSANILGARYFALKDQVMLKLVARRLLILALIVGVIFAFTYGLGARLILNAFTRDQKLIEVALAHMMIVALSQPLMSLAYLYDGLLFGLGRYRALGLCMFAGLLAIILPGLYFSEHGYGLNSIWLALTMLGIYRGVSGAYLFKHKLAGMMMR